MQFPNIELKIAVNDSFHSKGYLFKQGAFSNIIIGSSNLTQTALTSNKEWNLKISSAEEGLINLQIKNEFEREFESATKVTYGFIDEYTEHWKKAKSFAKKINFETEKPKAVVRANKMQKDALNNLTNLRNKGSNKALLISATGTGKTYLSAFDVQQYNLKSFYLWFIEEQLQKNQWKLSKIC